MSNKERLIAGVRRQQELLNLLIVDLQNQEQLDSVLCHRYERATKEVEFNLKKLRKLAAEELVKEIKVI